MTLIEAIKSGSAYRRSKAYATGIEARFWSKVDKEASNGCWLWTASVRPQGAGYGQVRIAGKLLYAHRVAYELVRGRVPNGLVLDHVCKQTRCVNPSHLEAVTQRTNLLRGDGYCGTNSRKTHCPQGHALVAGNLVKGRKHRSCLTCQKEVWGRAETRA